MYLPASDRDENIRRATEVARLLLGGGIVPICGFVSPYRETRERARASFALGDFVEIFVDAPQAVCAMFLDPTQPACRMMPMLRRFSATALSLAALFAATDVAAQTAWPARPVTLIVTQ